MEKEEHGVLFRERTVLKIRNMTRLGVFLLFLSSFALSVKGYSQQAKVTLSIEQRSLVEIVQELRKVFDYQFLYKVDELERYGKRDLKVTDASVDEVMEALLSGTRLTWRMEDNVILIRALAQDDKEKVKAIKITGKVTDTKKKPLPGVTIFLKEGEVFLGTTSGADGKYTLEIPSTLKKFFLNFTFVGMESQKIEYKGKDTINVVMKEDFKEMDEVVVTGYQTLKKRSQAGSISVVKAEDLVLNGTQTLEQALQGKIPGMMVMNRSGLTGTRQRVRVRGTSTLLGNAEPVWVVDGVIQEDPLPFSTNDFNNLNPDNMDMIRDFVGGAIAWLNPNDIETVTVLKDAASTAIYGVKAANGVIVITTKKGEVGRMSVSYTGNFSISPRMTYEKLELMNSQQRVEVSREAFANNLMLSGNQDIGYWALAKAFKNREITYEEFSREAKKLEENNTDWFDILFRNAFSHNHNVSISGGSNQATYRASFGVSSTKNTAKGNEQTQYTGNVAVSSTLWESVSLNTSLAGSVSKTKAFIGTDPYGYASTVNRAIPAYNEDGSYYFYQNTNGYLYNIENELKHSGNENTQSSLNASLNLRWRILECLALNTSFAYSYSNTNGEAWYMDQTNYMAVKRGYNYEEFGPGTDKYAASEIPNGGELNQTRNTSQTWSWRNQIEWNKVLDRHSFALMFGHEIRSSHATGTSSTSYGYMRDHGKIFVRIPIVLQKNIVNSLIDKQIPKLTDAENNFLSYYVTLSYMYDNRYSFNMSVRGDASNRFGQDKSTRFQPVWAMGLRWNVGSEHWLEGQNLLSDMSIRFSYGFQGNVAEGISPDLIATISTSDKTYDYELKLADLPAPELKWEKVQNLNLGIDWSLFKNKINGTFEWYYKKTTDMIVDYEVPYENGVNARPMNGGEMTNKGWDLSASFTPIRTKDWIVSVGLSTGKVYNEIKSELESTGSWQEAVSGNLNKGGYPVSSFWAFRFKGLNPENGGPEFDLTGMDTENAKTDATIYLDYAGKLEPDFTAGINFSIRYKTFSLTSGLYLSTGSQNFMANIAEGMSFTIPSEYLNMSTEWVERWRKPGDEKITNVPSLPNKASSAKSFQSPIDNTQVSPYDLYANSTIRVVDTWYLRCNSVSFAYTFPQKSIPDFMQNVSINCSISNPFQIRSKDFKGRDPEVALGSQPLQRTISLGLNISF